MAVKNTDSGKKVPALSDLIGVIVPMPELFDEKGKPVECDGLKLWKRPYSTGHSENIALMNTETACAAFEVSAQTLSSWAKDAPKIRIAYGWWSPAALVEYIQDRALQDQRGHQPPRWRR